MLKLIKNTAFLISLNRYDFMATLKGYMNNNRLNTCQYAQITDVGCVRDLNEDMILVVDNLCLLADGMGGHACGEVASQMAVDSIADEFVNSNDLVNAIQMAHQKIVKAGEEGLGQSGMGTTIVALASSQQSYEIAWVGDSRAYLWDPKSKQLTQLTKDHSLMMRLINAGLISSDEARNHPQRHIITQCLGSVELAEVEVDCIQGEWFAGMQILLCSDGLSDDVSENEMIQVLKQSISCENKLIKLVDLAKQKGGKDNISLLLVDSPIKARTTFWDSLKLTVIRYMNKLMRGFND